MRLYLCTSRVPKRELAAATQKDRHAMWNVMIRPSMRRCTEPVLGSPESPSGHYLDILYIRICMTGALSAIVDGSRAGIVGSKRSNEASSRSSQGQSLTDPCCEAVASHPGKYEDQLCENPAGQCARKHVASLMILGRSALVETESRANPV
jgi:hypothetical protein